MMKWLWLLCALALPAWAQSVEVPSITVHGHARAEVAPDQAIISVTAYSEGKELVQVKQEHDSKIQKLFSIAGELQIEKKHLKTQHSQMNPRYEYRERERVFAGYTASTTMDMTLRDIMKVGKALELLVASGFDRIGNTRYTVDDEQVVKDTLLSEALKNAKSKAQAMAASLGQSVGKPLIITEGASQQQPMPVMRQAMAAESMAVGSGAATAPPAGTMQIESHVTVSFELKE